MHAWIQSFESLASATQKSAPAPQIGAIKMGVGNYGGGFGAECIDDAPILREENGMMLMRYDPSLVTTKDPRAMLANARLVIALAEATPCATDITLTAGDIMVFKNYRLLHMRVAFTPHHAQRSRWLRRFYGRTPADVAST
jgi:hypothetical protein